MRWLSTPARVDDPARRQLLECWREVSNDDGAVGFPFPPVSEDLALGQVHLELRAGLGVEDFYASCSWKKVHLDVAIRFPVCRIEPC